MHAKTSSHSNVAISSAACFGENFIISMFKSLAVYRPNDLNRDAWHSHGCRLDSILRLAGNVACMGIVD